MDNNHRTGLLTVMIPPIEAIETEFIRWHNHGRVHRGLNGIPDPDPAIDGPKPLGGRLVAIPVLNGLHHDYRMAA